MARKNNVIEGQMSIFDFLAPPEPPVKVEETVKTRDIEKETILRGSGFANGKKRICDFFKTESNNDKRAEFLKNEYGVGGWSTDFGIVDHNAGGIDFKYDEKYRAAHMKEQGGLLVHTGWPMVAKRIDALIKSGEYTPEVCKFSKHTCNKEELWRVAVEIGASCPKTCCRVCDIEDCGARCNGAPRNAEPPILLQEGQIVYRVLRCDIIPYKVSGDTWVYNTSDNGKQRNYDLLTLDEHPSHSVCGNNSINNGIYLTLEDAERWQAKMIEIYGDELLQAKDMKIEKVVAYSYIHSDFYANGTDKEVINFYAILDNDLIYLNTGSKYDHCYSNIEVGIAEFENDKAKLLEYGKNITDLSDYEPVLQNMYKSGHDTWDYSEARYYYTGVDNGIVR